MFLTVFDVVDHSILLGELQTFDIDQFALNWTVSFLSNRRQVCKIDGSYFIPLPINQDIAQGSWLGPFLYLVMESDLYALPVFNLIFKYADDTSRFRLCRLLVGSGKHRLHIADRFWRILYCVHSTQYSLLV